jgi:type II secretory pathway pseudopilin PulG
MRKRGERGFALLLIFAMCAAMAVLLYMEMPRVLFEAQRNKEELLIERGSQYKRAIQVYYRKTKKLPQRVEDLERGTETRFLRQRYLDPFTGKDDWKFIETDGVNLKNSLVKKPAAALANGKGASGAPAEPLQTQPPQPMVALNPVTGQPMQQQPCVPGQPCEVNQALQRRPSDRPAAAAGQGDSQQPATLPACDPAQPIDVFKCDPTKPWDADAAAAQQQALQQQQLQQQQTQGQLGIPGQSPFPGQPYPGQPNPSGQQAAQAGFPNIPGMPGFPGASPAGRPGAPISSQTGGAATSPLIPGAAAGAGGQNSALGLINQLLTTPRPGGIPGQATATGLGPGIVGVATKHEGIGIKVYAEREKYQEWEFVFDPKEEKAPNMAGNQQGGTNPNNNPLGRGTGATGSGPSQSMMPASPIGQR